MIDTGPSRGTPFQQALGLRWRTTGDDSATVLVDMDVRPELCGPAGSVEGGVLCTLADVAGASVAARATGRLVATQHVAISFLAPGRVGPLRGAGTLLRAGRTDAVAEVRVTDTGKEDRLVAVGLVTVRVLDAETGRGDARAPSAA
jgi:uncharacterized protein (TIGR00369 family)